MAAPEELAADLTETNFNALSGSHGKGRWLLPSRTENKINFLAVKANTDRVIYATIHIKKT